MCFWRFVVARVSLLSGSFPLRWASGECVDDVHAWRFVSVTMYTLDDAYVELRFYVVVFFWLVVVEEGAHP